VLVQKDTEQAHDRIINSRLAYVSISRGRYDAQIYTNDAEKLGEELNRDISKQSAMENGHEIGGRDQSHAPANAGHQSVSESRVAQTLPFMSAPFGHLIQTLLMPGLKHFYGVTLVQLRRRHTNQCLRHPRFGIYERKRRPRHQCPRYLSLSAETSATLGRVS